LRKLGFLSTFTCSPYTIGVLPLPGNVMCWTGSSGQVISNTFFGARAGRESVSTCFAAAITGKTPLMGLLKKENRYAEILVKVSKELNPSSFDEADYGALGYYIGGRVGPRNTAIDGVPSDLTFEHGRMIVSPLPVSGACVMCHIIGVTPEANSIERVLGGRKYEMIVIGRKELAEGYEKLNNSGSKEIDMAVIGCPHLTIKEIGEVASLLDGKKVNRNVRLVVGVSRPTYTLAEECGFIDPIEKGGGIIVNSCVSALNPFMYVKDGAKIAATNSARAAHYMQRMSVGKTKTFYGNMGKCIQAAIKGRWEE
jgi:predicted aconitase